LIRPWNRMGFNEPVDFVALKAAIMNHLFERGQKTSAELYKEMRGTPGHSRIYTAVRYLKEEGMIQREGASKPWNVVRAK
jgi:predicted transcriptional regulator